MTASNAARPAPRLPIGALALLVAVAVAVFAGGLRLHKIDAQSFWYDEGNSARIAERSLQLIVEGAAGDIHPPFYYVLLHYWRAAFGESEAALRALSAACGVLLVLFTGLIARSMFDRRTGLIAAVLMAVSPFAVYYSQEARMYMLLALEAGVSTWALVALVALERQGARRKTRPLASCLLLAVCYTLATAAGLYTQYAYPFVMVAQGMCVLVWFFAARQPGTTKLKAILAYAAMNLAAIALFLPWLPTAIHQVTGWAVAPQTVDLRAAILDAYRWIIVGRTLPLDQAALPMLAVGALALIGLVPFRSPIPVELLVDGEVAAPDGSRQPAWLWPACLLILAVVPFALLFAFNLYRESYLKFLLVCALPVSILAARGIAVLSTAWRRPSQGRVAGVASAAVSIGLTVGLALLLLPSLDYLYNNPAYARDDYRGIARMIQADARPGDAVLFNAPNQWEVFTYYHRPGELAAAIPLTYHPADDASVDAQMRPIAEENDRLFVLYYGERESDPEGRYERWLAGHTFKADEQWVGNLRLAVYGSRPPTSTQPMAVRFGDAVQLEQVGLDLADRTVGDVVPIELVWRTKQKLSSRYKVFVHIGPPDAPPVAQNDSEPAAGFRPTDAWNPGEVVVDRRAVWLKPGTPPGHYGVYAGLYDTATSQRLMAHAADGSALGDRVWLGDIQVNPS